jgi:hypothetical protein
MGIMAERKTVDGMERTTKRRLEEEEFGLYDD